MASAYLLDANILIYAVDQSDTVKQARAIEVLGALADSESAAVSTQALAEFFVITTQRIPEKLLPAEACRYVEGFCNSFRVCEVGPAVVLEAMRAARDHSISYWDAQVWATAKLNQIPCVLTEDIPGRDSLEGIRFLNPLQEGFDISLLG
jgi:predicted nucleic acid-binding protein